MICSETRRLLDAYVDNELDLRGALELEEHLGRCPACAGEERGIRALQASARENLTRHSLPEGFSARLSAGLRDRTAAPPPPPHPMVAPIAQRPAPRWSRSQWAGIGSVAAALALVVTVGPRLWPQPAEATLENAVFAAHVRSLLANHLTDVASSDQHTVKPWFQGKLDYSVSAQDFAAAGFPLVGGRLDYIEDTPAAALVYKRGQHVVNLFVWPSRRGADESLQHTARRGYGAYRWTRDGMNYRAVSDLNDAELKAFVELVQRERG